MWQKFDTEGIVHKEFVPPGQMVNGKLYCDVLRRLRENIRCKLPDKWCNNSWVLNRDNALAHVLLVRQFLASTKTTVIPHPPYSPDLAPCDFFYSRRWYWNSRGDVLTALKRFRPNHRTWWRRWCEMTSWVLPIMEIPLRSLYQCQRRLLRRGWGWI